MIVTHVVGAHLAAIPARAFVVPATGNLGGFHGLIPVDPGVQGRQGVLFGRNRERNTQNLVKVVIEIVSRNRNMLPVISSHGHGSSHIPTPLLSLERAKVNFNPTLEGRARSNGLREAVENHVGRIKLSIVDQVGEGVFRKTQLGDGVFQRLTLGEVQACSFHRHRRRSHCPHLQKPTATTAGRCTTKGKSRRVLAGRITAE